MKKWLVILVVVCSAVMVWAAPAKKTSSAVPQFKTTDLSGKTVTESVFKDYSVTMINIWATWCSPCIRDMPELASLPAMLPSKANMITLCIDATSDEGAESAKEIAASVNGTFTTLIPDTALTSWLTSSIQAVPTTIFVDSTGKILGQPIVGVPRGKAADEYLKHIQKLLAQ